MDITARSLLLLIISLLAAAIDATSNIPAKFSTDDNSEVICHPNTPCYPRLFVATDKFQPIKPDQVVPPGLHVRLDVQTGQKEAKLYTLDENDTLNQQVVLSTDEGPTVIPAGAPREAPPAQQAIKPPKSAAGEQGLFDASLTTLLSQGVSEAALAPLAELVHEAYWGAHLTSTPGAVPRLLSLLSAEPAPLRAASALTLGSALSNNPKALSHAVSHPLAAPILTALAAETDEVCQKRILFLLGQTLRDGGVRGRFLAARGVDTLFKVFVRASKEVQGRVAVVVEDAFLNLDMRHDTGSAIEGAEELKALCRPFQDAVVTGEDSRVFSALVALKGCEMGDTFKAWAEAYSGEELEVVGRFKGRVRSEL